MNDALYSYIKNKVKQSFDQSEWSDDVGKLFEQNMIPKLNDSVNRMGNISYEVSDFIKKAEKELYNREET